MCLQDYKVLSDNVAVRSSGSSNARDAAAAQEALTDYMEVRHVGLAQRSHAPYRSVTSTSQTTPAGATRQHHVWPYSASPLSRRFVLTT